MYIYIYISFGVPLFTQKQIDVEPELTLCYLMFIRKHKCIFISLDQNVHLYVVLITSDQ